MSYCNMNLYAFSCHGIDDSLGAVINLKAHLNVNNLFDERVNSDPMSVVYKTECRNK